MNRRKASFDMLRGGLWEDSPVTGPGLAAGSPPARGSASIRPDRPSREAGSKGQGCQSFVVGTLSCPYWLGAPPAWKHSGLCGDRRTRLGTCHPGLAGSDSLLCPRTLKGNLCL